MDRLDFQAHFAGIMEKRGKFADYDVTEPELPRQKTIFYPF